VEDRHRAVVFPTYGDADVLRVVDRDGLEPGPGQVRISVKAAGVNPIDWKLRSGALHAVMPIELPAVPGVDVAGVVDRIGDGVAGLSVGDEVFGKAATGSYAEQALSAPDQLARRPSRLPWEIAAALPVAATSAHHVLDQLDLAPGETVVIDGAAGGVGTLVVQLARERELAVIGTASERNHDHLRALGATPVTYGEGLTERLRELAPDGIHGAVDAAGRGSLRAFLALIDDPHRVITLADPAAFEIGARYLTDEPDDMPSILTDVAQAVVVGTITVPIAATYPLAAAADAQRESERGHVRGKLALAVT
jgi:NADPH:quinone reductase-like Zn-dependent oxidoreductase